MAQKIDITEAKVYVGTYRKYNEGSLFGEWLKLSDYADKDDFYRGCRELHKDEEDPEFMFQDYENVPDGLIRESWISDNAFYVLEALQDMNESQREAFLIWSNNGHHSLADKDIGDLISDFDCEFIGLYKSEEDFATELIANREDLTDFARQYLDYEAYARDLFCSDYWSEDGYIFLNV
ncbi:antirestriction protein ArdA [Sphingobacterium sp. SRCM116780]|uniref:antirestriction protein ArdA n=1 Tax=Sphingobacterium sp. SRCM116780 TaxID=2907623 RepID=UPI001F1ACF26|nr:antirestriction protein ArdA [Sphingobacterium sp. SRCM116780]UIR57800.1 antirestriction protein ArdA [Sphingobacterium sp. SRCM116780]